MSWTFCRRGGPCPVFCQVSDQPEPTPAPAQRLKLQVKENISVLFIDAHYFKDPIRRNLKFQKGTTGSEKTL